MTKLSELTLKMPQPTTVGVLLITTKGNMTGQLWTTIQPFSLPLEMPHSIITGDVPIVTKGSMTG